MPVQQASLYPIPYTQVFKFMSRSYQTILFETDNQGIATVTINRPDKLNALNREVLSEIANVFKEAETNDQVQAVILTGSGGRAFVAGADIGELQALDEQSGQELSQKGQHIFQSVEEMPKPVVAAVEGYALGGGAELAMACHMRVASPGSVFGLPEVGLGIIPGYGGTQRLSRLVGRARALEMILTGRHVKAEEALQTGLVNKLADDPVEEARKLLDKILKNGPLAVRNAIKAVYRSDGETGYQAEAELFGLLCGTEDFKEGTTAFLEKRKPEFKAE